MLNNIWEFIGNPLGNKDVHRPCARVQLMICDVARHFKTDPTDTVAFSHHAENAEGLRDEFYRHFLYIAR
jgi:hypothetical protein